MGTSARAANSLLKHVSSPEVAGALFQLASFDAPVTAGAALPSAVAAAAYSAPVDTAITAAQSCDDPTVLARFAKSPRVTQRRAVAANPAISLETAERLLTEGVKTADSELYSPLADRVPPARYLRIATSDDSQFRRDTSRIAGLLTSHVMRTDDDDDLFEAAKAPDPRLPAAALQRAHALDDMGRFRKVLSYVAANAHRAEIVAIYLREAPLFDKRAVAAYGVVEPSRLFDAVGRLGANPKAPPVTSEAFAVLGEGGLRTVAGVHLLASCQVPEDCVDRLIDALELCSEQARAQRFIALNSQLLDPSRVNTISRKLTAGILREGSAQLLMQLHHVADDDELTGRLAAALSLHEYVNWLSNSAPTVEAATVAANILATSATDHVRRILSAPIPWETLPHDVADAMSDAFGVTFLEQALAPHHYGHDSTDLRYMVARLERRLGDHVEAWQFITQMLSEWSSTLGELIDTARLMFDIVDADICEVEMVEMADGQCAFAL